MDGGDLYDEFGNYIGPELQDSDESEEEREVESAKDEVQHNYIIIQSASSNILSLIPGWRRWWW